MAKTNIVIESLIAVILDKRDEDITNLVEDRLSGFPFGSGLTDEIKNIIREVATEIIVPDYIDNIDDYIESLNTNIDDYIESLNT
jgi:hypothetical protein